MHVRSPGFRNSLSPLEVRMARFQLNVFQRNGVLLRDATAIFVFSREAHRGTAHAGLLDSNFAPRRRDSDEPANEAFASLFANANSDGAGLAKKHFAQARSMETIAQHGQQAPRAIFLHLRL